MAPTAPNKKIPRKFYHHFLFKAFIITVFLVVIPLFPSEPPDFVTPSVFTRGWELLHLIFVGIAVSYGLFSRKNDDDSESDKHEINQTKTENNNAHQSVMSRLLNVSSVFDDETDVSSPSGSSVTDDHVKKVETWSSKYVRNEPMLVVAEQNSGISREKPLLLPVRSLRSRVSDDEKGGDFVDHGVSRVYNRSNTTPIVKGFSRNSKTLSRNDLIGLVHGEEDPGIVTSSRGGHGRSFSSTNFNEFSGDVNGNIGIGNNNGNNSEVSRSLHRSNSRNSRRHSSASHGEFDHGGGLEDSGGKVGESVVLPSPIPWRSRSGRLEVKELSPPPKELSPPPKELSPPPKEPSPPPKVASPRKLASSPTPTLESGGKTVEDFGRRKINYSSRLPPPPPPPPPPFQTSNRARSTSNKDTKKTTQDPSNDSIDDAHDGFNKSTNGVNAVRSYRPKEVESHPVTESHEINSDGYFGRRKSSFSEYPKETQDFLERVLLESDDESESEGESYKEERTETTKIDSAPPSEIVSDEGPDVDKKADEFIAKFREQIRLQRIESIKKSTGQLNRSSLR